MILSPFSILNIKINLRLILVSGRTSEFLFYITDSVATITQTVYEQWPSEWAEEVKPSTNILRLIYQGRFLHGNVTLSALQLQAGSTTVMHLVVREQLPEPNYQGDDKYFLASFARAGYALSC